MEPERALIFAKELEGFITSSAFNEQRTPASDAAKKVEGDAETRPRLLQGERRERFANAITEGVNNRELARRFGMTARQANAARMGLAKGNADARGRQVCSGGARSSPSAAASPLTRQDELAMQEEFLNRKPKERDTIDDVVRFLRQQGDIVVAEDGKYRVNSAQLLVADELVRRANRKRSERGQLAFAVTWTDGGQNEAGWTVTSTSLPSSSGDRPAKLLTNRVG